MIKNDVMLVRIDFVNLENVRMEKTLIFISHSSSTLVSYKITKTIKKQSFFYMKKIGQSSS